MILKTAMFIGNNYFCIFRNVQKRLALVRKCQNRNATAAFFGLLRINSLFYFCFRQNGAERNLKFTHHNNHYSITEIRIMSTQKRNL